MISFDFDYYQPCSIAEAVSLYHQLLAAGKLPIYYAGGTEIISMARMNQLFTKAVIDIKTIPECNVLHVEGSKLVIGSAVTLTQIEESNLFPLLSEVSKRTADRTSRNKMTIGGNISGKLMYRETVLPFLLADSQLVIAGNNGFKTVSIHEAFNERLHLQSGEILVQLITEQSYSTLPFKTVKKTKQSAIDYPLLTLAALKKDGQIRAAFSGVCRFPFRLTEIEKEISQNQMVVDERIDRALKLFPAPILDDIQGSKEYREFVLRNTLVEIIEWLEGVS
ncbi:FAD binding domain-containing protein [Fictibacillus gelatini]|uniref:FAD binding domain-containing protein n=1 Tax=Fictibacillus gelatini TaxID=225985 RepID=UPI0004122A05|nr:FAD binding domain-containing protein [Fictibacillus gelatini]